MTFAEAGVKDVVVESWYAVMAPAGTPADVVKKLQDVVLEIAHDKAFAAQLAEQGAYPYANGSADAAKLMAKEVKRWTDIVRQADIQMD